MYPASIRWVAQWYSSVHWINQWHSRDIPVHTGPASVHWLRVREQLLNSLWPCEAIWRHTSGSTLAQEMACCLTAPSRYLNQCRFIMSKVQRHLAGSLGHNLMPAPANVVSVASQCTCGSSGHPVCSNNANEPWLATERPLGDIISQCRSSVFCPVVSQCTDSIWFGGQQVRSLPSMQPLVYTTGMARVVWALTPNTQIL